MDKFFKLLDNIAKTPYAFPLVGMLFVISLFFILYGMQLNGLIAK